MDRTNPNKGSGAQSTAHPFNMREATQRGSVFDNVRVRVRACACVRAWWWWWLERGEWVMSIC
jgi:hypothetical protein